MATIIPQFDFGVNDIPTKATLTQQARSVIISDLTLSDITGGALGTLTGDDSGTTGALQTGEAVGMMWSDARGELWVQEQSGPVILKRTAGGWETRRYWVRPSSTIDVRPGLPIQGDGTEGPLENHARIEEDAPDASLPANVVRFQAPETLDFRDTSSGRLFGYAAETCASETARIVGRGGCLMRDHLFIEGDSQTKLNLNDVRNNISIAGARGSGDTIGRVMQKRQYTDVLTNKSFQGWVSGPDAGHSLVSDAGGNHTFHVAFFGYNAGYFQLLNEG